VTLLPKIVATAMATTISTVRRVTDVAALPAYPLSFGQDSSSSLDRRVPEGVIPVGASADELKPMMKALTGIFASGDTSGMATRLVDRFLAKQVSLGFFEDRALNDAVSRHGNIGPFCERAQAIVHQSLKAAQWDVEKILVQRDLGVPALNDGNRYVKTGDFNNGLGLMVNGIQHAVIQATSYRYNAQSKSYTLGLKYFFYDVFGLDDTDALRFGARGYNPYDAERGITAWWQLQHQFGYFPLITRMIVDKRFERPAT
jgi:hypothetical protein